MERIQIYGGVIVERRKLVQTVSQTETRRDVVINSFLMRRAKEKEKWISRIAVYFSLIRPIDSWHQSTSIIRFYIHIYIYITIAWKSIDDIKVFDVIYQYFHL